MKDRIILLMADKITFDIEKLEKRTFQILTLIYFTHQSMNFFPEHGESIRKIDY